MAVKVNKKQQEQFAELKRTDPAMAQKIQDAVQVMNGLPFNIEAGMVQVKLAIDVSGSMTGRYRNGEVQTLLEQFAAVAFLFDDNGALQVYPFDEGVYRHGQRHPYRRGSIDLPEMTLENYKGYVDRHIADLVQDGTHYAPAIRAVVDEMGAGGVGFCGFYTDGKNFDEDDAERAIRDASRIPLFFQFGAMGSSLRDFPFLSELDNLSGRKLDNAGVYLAQRGQTNQQMMRQLIAEFAGIDAVSGAKKSESYPEKARNAKLINDAFMWDGKTRL